MAKTNRRYYWIQLAQDFFKSKEMKLLRKMPGGDTYTIIYLKLMLISLEDNGKIFYEGLAQDLAEEMALLIDEDTEAVRMTLIFLSKKGLLTKNNNFEFFLEQVPEMVGSETASTRRSRKHREQKALHCNTNATKCNGEIDIDIEKDIDTEEEEKKDDSASSSSDSQNLKYFFDKWQEITGRALTPFEIEDIPKLHKEDGFSIDLMLTALKEAANSTSNFNFNYFKSILMRYKRQGLLTPEMVAGAEKQRQEAKDKQYFKQQPAKSNVPEWVDEEYKHEATADEQAKLDALKAAFLEE